jgi:hypothetical protein
VGFPAQATLSETPTTKVSDREEEEEEMKRKMMLAMAALLVVTLAGGVSYAQQAAPPAGGQQWGPGMGWQAQGGGWCGMGPGGMRFGPAGLSLVDITAQVTGVDRTVIWTELQSGKTFAQIAEAHGKTSADLEAALVASRKTAFDQAVAAGWMTAEAAQQRLAFMQQNAAACVNTGGVMRGPGRGGVGMGRGRGGMRGGRWIF